MPIVLPKEMPAYRILGAEGVEVLAPGEPGRGRGAALRIAILNLMPDKAVTETQLARVLGDTAHLVEPTFFVPESYRPKTAPPRHMAAFYTPWPEIRQRRFDGLIVTGAPVETLPFADVTYWPELTAILDWARQCAGQAFHICWAAQAALQHYHGVPKRPLGEKSFGVFAHRNVAPESPLLRGLGAGFPVPVSRHTEVAPEDLPGGRGLQILARSDDSGLGLIHDPPNRACYMFNHLEYDAPTLAREYARDRAAGRPVPLPRNYFPGDDPAREPAHTWRGAARVLFRNWLDEVRRHADARNGVSGSVDWFLGNAAMPVGAEAHWIDLMIAVDDALAAVPEVLRVLAVLGVSPASLRVKPAEGAERVVCVRIPGGVPIPGEVFAKRILARVATARRVAHRDSQGAGGLMVLDRAGGLGPAKDRAPSRCRRLPNRSAA